MNQSLYKKGRDGDDTTWDINDAHIYMIHVKGSFSFIDYSKGRLSFWMPAAF